MRAVGAPRIRPAVAVQTLFVLFGIFIAASFPFLSLFLDGKGLTAGEIGVVIAAMAIARVLLSPLWGHLADTSLGRRRALQIGALGGAIGAFALFGAETYPAIIVAAFAFAGLSATVAPNVDAIALEFLGDDRMTEYGRIRGWESLAYATACLLIGVLLQQVGIRWAMPVVASAALAIFLWAAVAIEPDRPARSIRHGRLGAVGAVFRAAPRFWMFLLALLLVWTGFNAAWNFIGLKIERAGGGPLLVGIGTALGGLVEVPVMRLSSRFSKRFGLRAVYVAGCVVYATGFLLWGLVEDPDDPFRPDGVRGRRVRAPVHDDGGRDRPHAPVEPLLDRSVARLRRWGSGSPRSSARGSAGSCSIDSARRRCTSAPRFSRSAEGPSPGSRCPRPTCPAPHGTSNLVL